MISTTQKEIWMWVEPFLEKPPKWLSSLIQAGRLLAEELNVRLVAVFMGNDGEDVVRLLSQPGVTRLIKIEHPMILPFNGAMYHHVLKELISIHHPLALLTASSPMGRELTARLSSQEDCWFVPRCTGIYSLRSGHIRTSKLVLGGQMEKWTDLPLDRLLIVSIQVEYLPMANPVTHKEFSCQIPIEEIKVPSVIAHDRILDMFREDVDGPSLEDSEVIVAGGRGVRDRSGFQLVEHLARALRGTVAGTQYAVDMGWIPHSRQIGRSGLTVTPDLFIACGISGSVHFTAGMENSKTIVAINIDPEAPIFRIADVSIIGDLSEVIPSLIRKIEEKRIP